MKFLQVKLWQLFLLVGLLCVGLAIWQFTQEYRIEWWAIEWVAQQLGE